MRSLFLQSFYSTEKSPGFELENRIKMLHVRPVSKLRQTLRKVFYHWKVKSNETGSAVHRLNYSGKISGKYSQVATLLFYRNCCAPLELDLDQQNVSPKKTFSGWKSFFKFSLLFGLWKSITSNWNFSSTQKKGNRHYDIDFFFKFSLQIFTNG